MQLTRKSLFTLALTIIPSGLAAQNGTNLQIFTNGLDAIYSGIGAGGAQVGGVDGLGTFVSGEDLKGTTLTNLGSFGYKHVATTEIACVLGQPNPNLRIDFPLIALFELDGRNPNQPDVFTLPQCGSAGSFPLGNSGGFVPYGSPPGSTVSFLLATLPSGISFPSFVPSPMLPNHGLTPSSNGGTVAVLAAGQASIPIASTGFCWTVTFGWSPSAIPMVQGADGLWHWLTNSRDDNQYWAMSNDELNVWQTRSALLDSGATTVGQFLANLDYAWFAYSRNPVTQDALAPASPSASGGPFYTTGAGCPLSGSSVNGGFDMGRHIGISLGGAGGVPNPFTGLGNQDPAGAAITGLTPTLGFVTFNNNAYLPPGTVGGWRLTWLQIDFDMTFGVDPALASSAVLFFGGVRVPICIPFTSPGSWPQSLTTTLFNIYRHDTGPVSSAIPGCWQDPTGQGGFFDAIAGSSLHVGTAGSGSVCIGLPIGITFGSSGLLGPGGPLTWDPTVNQTSLGRTLSLID
jgi:hypothetical protein